MSDYPWCLFEDIVLVDSGKDRTVAMHKVVEIVGKEIEELAHSLEKHYPSETRGDVIRRYRAAIELLGAQVPKADS